jgi:hypothetical protein
MPQGLAGQARHRIPARLPTIIFPAGAVLA